MAKVKLPLISLEARGAIGKAIVYFPWKGINAVREYVIPANPQTTAQMIQRGYLTDAVADWHASEFTPSDAACWRLAATIVPKILTGANTFIRTHILNSIAGKTWIKHHDFKIDGWETNGFYVSVESDDITTLLKFEVYRPIYYKLYESNGSYHAGTGRWVGTLPGLQSKTTYFMRTIQDGVTTWGEIRYLKGTTI